MRGAQVAPAELEAVLIEHPLIADAAVIGITRKVCYDNFALKLTENQRPRGIPESLHCTPSECPVDRDGSCEVC